jgi:hypothetical protein
MQNKRYRINPRPVEDVVNRNGASVYQTDQVLICIGPCNGSAQGASKN